jgi:hypothetical protein
MVQIEINGLETKLNPQPSTWRELLSDVETRCLKNDQVISSVQFDGNEIATFREEDVLQQPLGTVGQIRIAAVEMRELSLSALRDSEKHLESLTVSIVETAENYRNGHADISNEKLPHILKGIKLYMAILRGIELSVTQNDGKVPSLVETTIGQMKPVLEALIAAQRDRDWPLLADILEYEISAELSAFEPIAEEFKVRLERS